jgi:hypothetical protein
MFPDTPRESRMKPTSYANPKRLADVMALIQVLALKDKDSIRSVDGLLIDLGKQPDSGLDWTQIAEEHPEFFRVLRFTVRDNSKLSISLLARVITAKGTDGKREPLPDEFVAKLLEIAVNLHDRERARMDKWKPWLISILVALIIGLSGIVTASIKAPPSSPCTQVPPTK